MFIACTLKFLQTLQSLISVFLGFCLALLQHPALVDDLQEFEDNCFVFLFKEEE